MSWHKSLTGWFGQGWEHLTSKCVRELTGKSTQQLIASKISRMETYALKTLLWCLVKIRKGSAGRLLFANTAPGAAGCQGIIPQVAASPAFREKGLTGSRLMGSQFLLLFACKTVSRDSERTSSHYQRLHHVYESKGLILPGVPWILDLCAQQIFIKHLLFGKCCTWQSH